MIYLFSGLMLWSVVHFFPSVFASSKAAFVNSVGQLIYMAVFVAMIVLSLVLIVTGWGSSVPTYLYMLPGFVRPLSVILMAIAFILFVASKLPTKIKQFIRHPQLLSVVIWAVAHLLVNGDSRSILLFSWLGLWAVIEIVLINKREGKWVKPPRASWLQDLVCFVVGVVVFSSVIFLHPHLSGVPLR
ncbi:NnrU family protein [Moritella sp. Urea-trap-13]|uniref:NnrU family protein n=1 Tax=Moritella sp. Urea-trap-13 TaxID=2058327 RepID=UPI000C3423D0|nr:NnrU family protein [Moritella sp. Urea-trap-13]PKH06626.1 NnrU protein [Moritella sp. Urea-trap-13]